MNSTEICILLCGVGSLLILAAFLIYGVTVYRKIERSQRALSTLMFITFGVFVATVVIFIPHYYCDYDFVSGVAAFRPLLMAIHNAMRAFILDGEFDTIRDTVEKLVSHESLSWFYTVYAAILYVLAPVMTFSTVMSFFKNFVAEMRYKICTNRPIYIMSELNERSMVLAKSIRNAKSIREKFGSKKPVIVFTDVYAQNEEDDQELMLEARNIRAICFRRDVTQLNIIGKKGDVEIFLIGEDEAENVSQAAAITKKLDDAAGTGREKQNVKLFVFAASPASGYTIDSIRRDKLMKASQELECSDHAFKLRRVNYIRQLVWQSIGEMNLIPKYHNGETEDNLISVVIAGMGAQGIEFFKALVWYCQVDGVKLEITLIDKRSGKKGNEPGIKAILRKECPELMKVPKRNKPGDAIYDIEVYDDIDFNTDSFEESLFENPERSERLRRAKTVIVALGDDDANIETAVYLRKLYDRVRGFNKGKLGEIAAREETAKGKVPSGADDPKIYSIVYDKVKSGVVKEDDSSYLLDQTGSAYQIHFIGSINRQFSYENIYDFDLERDAEKFHTYWSDVNQRATDELKKLEGSDLAELGKEYGYSDEETERLAVMIREANACYGDISYTLDANAKNNEIRKYDAYEYYRMASLANAMHKKMLGDKVYDSKKHPKCEHIDHKTGEPRVFCPCETCLRRKMTEHARWNAYMRAMGFCSTGKNDSSLRADRAMMHHNLCDWDELSIADRIKD